jgi:uncharacterized membrane protein YbhN (UPF0104 family)
MRRMQRMQWIRLLRVARRPRLVLPLIGSAALLAGLLAITGAGAVLRDLLDFSPTSLALYLLLMLIYEGVRTLQWLLWLRALGVSARTPLGVRIFAFLAGEGGQLLPAGNYLRAYLLRQAGGTAYSSSMPATTATMWIEDAVALAAAAVFGVPGWGWLRPAALLTLLGLAATAALVYALLRSARRPAWVDRYPRLRPLLEEGSRFRQAALLLAHPRLLAAQTALGALYLAIAALGFYVIVEGLGLRQVTLAEALGVYAFSLAIGLLTPLPLDLGLIEVSGVGALVACGVPASGAVSAMLLQRLLSGGLALLLAGGTALVFARERHAALRGAPLTLERIPAEQFPARTDPHTPRA